MTSRINVECDHSANACYVRLSDQPISRTIEFKPASIMVDVDDVNEVVGIELLGLDQNIPLTDLCRRFHIRDDRAAQLSNLLPSIAIFFKTTAFASDPVIHSNQVALSKADI